MSLWQTLDSQKKGGRIDGFLNLLTGDPSAGEVLRELLYWARPKKGEDSGNRQTVKKNGFTWVARHRKQWLEHNGLTERRYRSAVSLLQEAGLIEVDRTLYWNKVTPLFRLQLDALEQSVNVYLDTGVSVKQKLKNVRIDSVKMSESKRSKRPDQSGQNVRILKANALEDTLEMPFSGDVPSQGEAGDAPQGAGEQSRSEEQSPHLLVEEKQRANVSMALMDKLHPPKETPMAKAEDVLAQFHNRHSAFTGKAQTTDKLAAKWQREVASLTATFQRGLTAKERSQLKRVAQEVAGTDVESMVLIEYTVRNWSKFTNRAKVNAGLATVPDLPHVGFFSKHYPSAVQLIAEKRESHVPAPPETKTTVQTAPPPVPLTKPDEEPPLTYEQVMEIFQQGKKS